MIGILEFIVLVSLIYGMFEVFHNLNKSSGNTESKGNLFWYRVRVEQEISFKNNEREIPVEF